MTLNTIKQDNTKTVKRKSAALAQSEKIALRKFTKQYTSLTEAAEELGVSRQVLQRVMLVWSGSPDNISIIRQKIGSAA